MARVHFVKKARKDNAAVKKGESYYWWKFRFGGKHVSATHPRPSQLTQSEFLSNVYDIQERIEDCDCDDIDSLQCFVEGIVSELYDLAAEQQDKLSNMPDQLQDSDTGQLLQDRADACESMGNDLEAIDLDIDMEEIEADLDNENPDKDSREDRKNELIAEKIAEIISDIQQISYDGE